MSREAVQKLAGRMYQSHVKATGRLPMAKEIRDIEKKALMVAERAENKGMEKAGKMEEGRWERE